VAWVKQRGSDIGYKIIVGIYHLLGYKTTKIIVWIVSFVYACITTKEREAMKVYYAHLGISYTFFLYVSHIYQFSLSIFDRFVTRINPELFHIERVNVDTFWHKDKNRILALSHIGSWANTLVAFKYESRTVHITANEQLKSSIVEYEASLTKESTSSIHIINLQDGIKASIEIVKALQHGDDLAIMVDRLVDSNRFIEVDFLDQKTKLNKNPFEIAYNRDVDMVGVTVIRMGDMQYKVVFSDIIRVDKSRKKEEAMGIMAQAYAGYLEKLVREYPLQWFNFYKFWENE